MTALKEHEKAALRQLYAHKMPPKSFHRQLFERMKNEQLIHTPRPLVSASLPGLATAVAVILAVAALGFYAGKAQHQQADVPVAAKPAGKEKFVLFVHNDDVPAPNPEEQFEAYSAWLQDIKAVRFADGEALHGDRLMLHKSGAAVDVQRQALTQGNREEVSGFFIFEADNLDEATKIAQTCPHLNYQGTVELRKVFQ